MLKKYLLGSLIVTIGLLGISQATLTGSNAETVSDSSSFDASSVQYQTKQLSSGGKILISDGKINLDIKDAGYGMNGGGGNTSGQPAVTEGATAPIVVGVAIGDFQIYYVGHNLVEYDLYIPYSTQPYALNTDVYMNNTHLDSFKRYSTDGPIGYSKTFGATPGRYYGSLRGYTQGMFPNGGKSDFVIPRSFVVPAS
ncbi:hypothetical protein [Companilactobacillus metriopterae]|uniref:hypothetical protein n=1 Tax=Companilactobacillus metriopterae TaxID=1909267 RepID=UPI00100BCE88|nr:hypothetical protein [Companilactobacillus metriopterae]